LYFGEAKIRINKVIYFEYVSNSDHQMRYKTEINQEIRKSIYPSLHEVVVIYCVNYSVIYLLRFSQTVALLHALIHPEHI
jgi:hypothetical protein